MFKGYLRQHPVMFQLAVFVGLWSILQLIVLSVVPIFLHNFFGEEVIASIRSGDIDPSHATALIVMGALGQVLTFALPPLIFGYLSAPNLFRYLEFRPLNGINITIALVLGLLMLLVFPLIGSLIGSMDLGEWAKELQEKRIRSEALYFGDKSNWALFRNLCLMAILPAFCEELFFRGIVQRFMHSWTHHAFYSILFTAIFFASVHSSIINFLPIVMAGILLGYIFHLSGNLWMSVIVHFIYNAAQVWMEWKDADFELSIGVKAGLILAGSVCILLLMRVIRARNRSLPPSWSVQEIVSDQNQDIKPY